MKTKLWTRSWPILALALTMPLAMAILINTKPVGWHYLPYSLLKLLFRY